MHCKDTGYHKGIIKRVTFESKPCEVYVMSPPEAAFLLCQRHHIYTTYTHKQLVMWRVETQTSQYQAKSESSCCTPLTEQMQVKKSGYCRKLDTGAKRCSAKRCCCHYLLRWTTLRCCMVYKYLYHHQISKAVKLFSYAEWSAPTWTPTLKWAFACVASSVSLI